MENIKADFRSMREGAGLTPKDVADRTGYNVQTIYALENSGRGAERLKKVLMKLYQESQLSSVAVLAEQCAPGNHDPSEFFNDLADLHERLRQNLEQAQKAVDAAAENYKAITAVFREMGIGEAKPVPQRDVNYGGKQPKTFSSVLLAGDLEILASAEGAPESGHPKRRPSR